MREAEIHPTEFLVTNLPIDSEEAMIWGVRVSWRGHGRWAVTRVGLCLGTDGEWSHELLPSNREADWLEAHRFSLDEAKRLAVQHAPGVKVNGLTAAEVAARLAAVLEKVAARLAAVLEGDG